MVILISFGPNKFIGRTFECVNFNHMAILALYSFCSIRPIFPFHIRCFKWCVGFIMENLMTGRAKFRLQKERVLDAFMKIFTTSLFYWKRSIFGEYRSIFAVFTR